jgi:CRISPR/Cas system-associated exonuclease Cas4 (RecB family)
LKYSLQYKRGYYAEDTVQNVLTRKGNAFHQFAEHYDPSWSPDYINQRRLELEKQFTLPEEFSLEIPIKRFLKFYDEVMAPVIFAGGKVHKEIEFKFELDGNNFTGKLDVLLEKPDGSFHIIDYKTGKSSNTSYYVDQMMLYAWALHKQYGIPEDQIVNKVAVNIYFALADQEKEDPLKVFKAIKFTKQTLDEVRRSFADKIAAIESNTWAPEANLNRMCEFCPFCGFSAFCPLSAKSGLVPIRGIKIKQREWAVTAGIK